MSDTNENLESYVFYQSFHEAGKMLDITQYGQLMYALNEYALYHKEPEELPAILMGYFLLIKPQIEANWRRRENGKYGNLGGRPKKTKNPMGFENQETKNPMGFLNSQNKNPMGFENDETENPNVNVNVNVNVNENENVNTADAVENSPSLSTLSTSYSDTIFKLFSNAGLPCSNNNSLTFLQRDFKNAMAYLHNKDEYKTLHSDEIISAVKNYIEVWQDPNTWVSNAYNFEKLVKTKNFSDYLPANFVKNNFIKYSVADEKEKEYKPVEEINIFKKLKAPKTCSCGGQFQEALKSPPMIRCMACNAMLEYNPSQKKWE